MMTVSLLAGVAALSAAGEPGPAHLELQVALDIENEALTVEAALTAPRSAWREGWALNAALDLTEAGPGVVTAPSPDGSVRLIRHGDAGAGPPDEPLTARFSYAGRLSRAVMPFPLDRIHPDAVELSANSMWLPVHAGFSERYTVTAEISGLPNHWTIAAPGQVARGPDAEATIRRETPDLDLAFFAAPDLTCRGDGAFTVCTADMEAGAVEVVTRHGAAALDQFSALFGPPEVARTTIALVERDRSGGYARLGYMVMDLEPGDTEAHLAAYVAHEFAHSWFFAPIGSPDDHWLIESPAEYAAWRYMQMRFGEDARTELEAAARAGMAGAGPLSGAGRASHAALYRAGPVFLAELERRIGRDALDTVLRLTLAEPVMTTAGFIDAVRQVAGEAEAERARERIYDD
jgi:hypothetical protein